MRIRTRAVVRLLADGDHPRRHRHLHAVERDDERPSRPAHARADRRRHHARLSDGFHADGHGCLLRVARLPQPSIPISPSAQVLDLFVQRTYGVMSNDVLIAIPLFVFMGYLVERAALIDKLFRSLHLATARVPGSLAVATIVTCAIFATATGIVGAVVTLMGLLAFPAMLKAGYNVKVSAGCHHRGRLSRHTDSAFGAADRLRRDGRRFGRAALRRRVLPGHHAGRAVPRLRHRAREVQPDLMPPLAAEAARGAAAVVCERLAQRGKHALVGTRARRRRRGERRARSAPWSRSSSCRCCRRSRSPRSLVMIHRMATAPASRSGHRGLEINTVGRSRRGDAGTGLAAPPAESHRTRRSRAETGTGLAARRNRDGLVRRRRTAADQLAQTPATRESRRRPPQNRARRTQDRRAGRAGSRRVDGRPPADAAAGSGS